MSVLIVKICVSSLSMMYLQLLLRISFTDDVCVCVYICCDLNNMRHFPSVVCTRKALLLINLGHKIIIQGVCFS